ncbi:MAG: hypothetical protein H7281_14185 [Bacteriovorax sp.]|nr:hypothetical protein [Bacteriovorax sp.]
MKTLITLSFFIATTLCFSFAAKAMPPEGFDYTCTNHEINIIYIPILQEVVDWPTSQIRPYAIELCH